MRGSVGLRSLEVQERLNMDVALRPGGSAAVALCGAAGAACIDADSPQDV